MTVMVFVWVLDAGGVAVTLMPRRRDVSRWTYSSLDTFEHFVIGVGDQLSMGATKFARIDRVSQHV